MTHDEENATLEATLAAIPGGGKALDDFRAFLREQEANKPLTRDEEIAVVELIGKLPNGQRWLDERMRAVVANQKELMTICDEHVERINRQNRQFTVDVFAIMVGLALVMLDAYVLQTGWIAPLGQTVMAVMFLRAGWQLVKLQRARKAANR